MPDTLIGVKFRLLVLAPLAALVAIGCTGAPAPSASPTVADPGSLFTADVGFAVAATKTADSSNDAAGNPVSYNAINLTDGDPSTAWRKATGEWSADDYILITFDHPVMLTQVGLIPGYAKIDPKTGTDRFLQNHRLQYVTWALSDGSTWEQEFVDEPTMQTIPVAGTVTWVRVGSLSTRSDEQPAATRDYLAISDVSLIGTVAP